MIRKSGYRFSGKIMLKQRIERDDDSKKSHPALGRGASRLVGPDPHKLLAEIGALQKSHERAWRAVEPFGDELAMLDLALAHPPRHVAQEVRMARGEIADDKASDIQPLGQHGAHHG